MSQGVPRAILTHAQRVCRAYKKAIRTLEYNYYNDRTIFRYEAVLLRAQFDESKKENDMRKLAAMVEHVEEECWRLQPPQPFIFKDDPGGIIYERYHNCHDDELDSWHPWEKAAFIDYFETREKRKQEAEEYYKNVIMNKAKGNLENIEFPAKGPHV